ncbi:oxidoreductase (plasmid) [Pseudosulfitobacter pseudonitzschiae]|uniref:Oxidoreductase n=2 Tax=Pseudosulfitobacter pseudonitzschiae TaxID=1402135 RepID=A0A221K7Y6_9RHOB|nr:molybdopterin-dependent oxidoreductase [Sulfitobacter sp. DFL-23]ASM75089.1 oxidoreductase [Pseudosulfitobacter pseudonitzschiae]
MLRHTLACAAHPLRGKGDARRMIWAQRTARAAFVFAATSLSAPVTNAEEGTFPAPAGEVVLTITGNISQTNRDHMAVFDEEMLRALPWTTLETTTVVTDGVKRFDGFLMRDLLDYVGAEGTGVTAVALNDYVIEIPMEDFSRFDVLIAASMDGKRLLPSDKGPFWIVYPRDDHEELQDIRYDYRWVWQLIELEVH